MSRESLSLYIHVPFCRARCPYCDFNTYAGMENLIPRYVSALIREIGNWRRLRLGGEEATVSTIYFGGGTPSLLPPSEIACILQVCAEAFALAPTAEISLEANPGTIDASSLNGFRRAGVKRLSIGAQSFDDAELRVLGRQHNAAEVARAFAQTRAAGFDNISLDLIFGIPGQSLEDWEQSLTSALVLRPEHLSLYQLTLEDHVPMAADIRAGRISLPSDDLAAEMYILAEDMLANAGYRHYEISNWTKPGYECCHNLTYWRNRPYLGLGAGAHSYLPPLRFANVLAPSRYIDGVPATASELACDEHGIASRSPLASVERIDKRKQMAETMMLGLRLEEGVKLAEFAERFDIEVDDAFPGLLEELQEPGLLQASEGAIRLTRRGRLLGNEVFVRFFQVGEH